MPNSLRCFIQAAVKPSGNVFRRWRRLCLSRNMRGGEQEVGEAKGEGRRVSSLLETHPSTVQFLDGGCVCSLAPAESKMRGPICSSAATGSWGSIRAFLSPTLDLRRHEGSEDSSPLLRRSIRALRQFRMASFSISSSEGICFRTTQRDVSRCWVQSPQRPGQSSVCGDTTRGLSEFIVSTACPRRGRRCGISALCPGFSRCIP